MSTSALPWRKRSFDIDLESPIQSKRRYWFRLESESSAASTADDTESVYSIQGKETDIVKDTSDTESISSEYDVDIEYEIASLSDDDREEIVFDSSGGSDAEGMMYAAAVVGDSSLETFITDAEDSDNSRQGDSSTGLTDFWICIQCKSQNDNPQFRFCDKCFQGRKAFFPPRPRRRKKAERTKEKSHSPVKLDALKSCLSGLSSQGSCLTGLSSQDSGIGSSQEFSSLCLDQIIVPSIEKPTTKSTSGFTTVSSSSATTTGSFSHDETRSRKRQISESSLSDEYEEKRPKKAKTSNEENKENGNVESKGDDKKNGVVINGDAEQTGTADEVKGPLPELKEDCIMCNEKPKNSVFLHGRIAHMCCCYGCAMRTWKALKRCPICKRKVSNVVRVFTT